MTVAHTSSLYADFPRNAHQAHFRGSTLESVMLSFFFD